VIFLRKHFCPSLLFFGLAFIASCEWCNQAEKAGHQSEFMMECEYVSGGIKRCVNDEVICYKLFGESISCLRNEKR